MLTTHKIFSNIYVFIPQESSYKVRQNGRALEEEGSMEALYLKYRKKFPTLIKALVTLMNDNELFFYDPFFNSFRTVNKEKTLDESINYYYEIMKPTIHMKNIGRKLENNFDIIEINPYISNFGLDNNSCTNKIEYSQ